MSGEHASAVDVSSAPTIPAPPKTCTCCATAILPAAWMASKTRRPWPDLFIELAEICCGTTLAIELNDEPAIVR